MNYIHIISVGSSIITNYRNKIDNSLPLPQNDEDYKRISTNMQIKRKMYEFLQGNPSSASAELNSLQEYLDKKQVSEVHFVYTKTFMCQIALELLRKYLKENHKISVGSGQPISGYYREKKLNPQTSGDYFTNDILRLKNKLVRFIERKRKSKNTKIFINATGGFKTETAILVMVGSLTKTPVYYKHEFFGGNIQIPQLL